MSLDTTAFCPPTYHKLFAEIVITQQHTLKETTKTTVSLLGPFLLNNSPGAVTAE